jgi:hypothetical protein
LTTDPRNELLLGYFCNAGAAAQFRPAQIETLELIARIAAIAIEHARRHEEERRRSSRFELIAHCCRYPSQPDRDALLQRAADAIPKYCFQNVDIPLLDPPINTLVVCASAAAAKAVEGRLPADFRGIMGAAVREGRTQLVNDDQRPALLCPPGPSAARAAAADRP